MLAGPARRATRAIGGGGVGLARLLHETAPGGAWPFVIVDERIGDTASEQLATLKRARTTRWWSPSRAGRRTPASCATPWPRAPTARGWSWSRPLVEQTIAIEIPSIVQRAKVDAHGVELSRLLELALAEHGSGVGVAGQVLKPGDMASLIRHDWSGGHKMLDEMVSRLLLVRVHGKDRGGGPARPRRHRAVELVQVPRIRVEGIPGLAAFDT